jgi:hypothetical protein
MPREAFEQRMHDLLDRRMRPEEDDELRAQAEASDQCRELLIGQQRLFEGLAVADVPELPANFAQRSVAVAWDSHPGRAPRQGVAAQGRRFAGWIAAACAVALIVAAYPVWSWLNQPQGGVVNAPVGQNRQTPHDENSPPARGLEVANHLSPQSNPSPTNNAADNSSDRYQDIYQALMELRQQEGLLTTRPQWVDEVALGFKPVATSMGEALNMLRRNLPPSGENSKPETPEKPQAMGDGPLDAATIS